MFGYEIHHTIDVQGKTAGNAQRLETFERGPIGVVIGFGELLDDRLEEIRLVREIVTYKRMVDPGRAPDHAHTGSGIGVLGEDLLRPLEDLLSGSLALVPVWARPLGLWAFLLALLLCHFPIPEPQYVDRVLVCQDFLSC